jgi:hypothetical protein
MLLDVAGAMMAEGDQESLISMTNFVDQLPSVLNQVLRYFFFILLREHTRQSIMNLRFRFLYFPW